MEKPNLAVCFDFDSTVVSKESLDLVIERALGEASNSAELMAQVEAITNASMNGELPFTESLQRRFAVVPLSFMQFEAVGEFLQAHITPGMSDVFNELKKLNIPTFIISGGFRPCLLPVAKMLGVPSERVVANEVVTDETGSITGIDTSVVCYTNDGKAPVIEFVKEQFGLTGSVCMIGDGANDLQAYQKGVAEYFIGFTANAKRDIIVQNAPHVAENSEELLALLRELYASGGVRSA